MLDSLEYLNDFSQTEFDDVPGVPSGSTLVGVRGLAAILQTGLEVLGPGLDHLESVGADDLECCSTGLSIGNNDSLRAFALQELEFASNLEVAGNPALSTFSFPALRTLFNNLLVRGNAVLDSVVRGIAAAARPPSRILHRTTGTDDTAALRFRQVGFNALETITGAIVVSNNRALREFGGFNNLTAIVYTDDSDIRATALQFDNNPELTTISGFEKLELVEADGIGGISGGLETISFSSCDKLATIPAFPALAAVETNLFFSGLASLTSISGFNALATIGRLFSIQFCESLETVTGFTALEEVGEIKIQANSGLTSLAGVRACFPPPHIGHSAAARGRSTPCVF